MAKAGLRVEVGARSDVGMVRHNNEDCFAVDPELKLFVLCDGMGGQAAGEVASKLAVDVISEHCRHATKNPKLEYVGEYKKEFSAATNRLASGIRLSNQAIREAAQSRPGTSGMGSTVVAAQLTGNVLSIAHVGDSRIYLLRDGPLRQLTRDHSLVMEQVRKGLMTVEEAEHSEMSNVILRALGAEPTVQVDVDELWVQSGDQVLLCSDGLTRMVSDAGIAQVLAEANTAQHACERLVEIANDNGGEDNVTAVVGRLKPSSRWTEWMNRIRSLFGGD
ncbi:MAG: Stp1/IreP family PP2C-type Ser/Thr phosphatase [Acidobacteria bacterium]|nr:Stp1/IreP family PP2C-type Ser/Thr phosphatase [Acidobacteriota bacterium]